jgi:hypothetical protein
MIEAYPLYWPEGWKRTESWRRQTNRRFSKGFAASRNELINEIRRLGGKFDERSQRCTAGYWIDVINRKETSHVLDRRSENVPARRLARPGR